MRNRVIGSNRIALEAAVRRARELGYRAQILSSEIVGETRDVLLVGHFPHLPRLLAMLLGQAESIEPDFPTNGVVALARADERWTEEWRLG